MMNRPIFDLDAVAASARLNIGPEERTDVEADMRRILELTASLLEKEPPMCREDGKVLPVCHDREDCPAVPFLREDILANAPDTDGECFSVPQIMDGEAT